MRRGGVGFPQGDLGVPTGARDARLPTTAMGDNALMSDVLELVDVSVVRDGRALVDQVSWSVKEGERWVILGPNGAGKTTLLNVASSYLFPTTGTVHDPRREARRRRRLRTAPPHRHGRHRHGREAARAARPSWRPCSPPRTA